MVLKESKKQIAVPKSEKKETEWKIEWTEKVNISAMVTDWGLEGEELDERLNMKTRVGKWILVKRWWNIAWSKLNYQKHFY